VKSVSAPATADVAFADGRLSVSGMLTFDTVPDAYARSAAWVSGGAAASVDLARVQRADSAGLALMVEWLRLARIAGRGLKFIQIPEQVHEIIRVNGLERAFNAARS